MRAAKWNTDCERGAVWLRRLSRRGPDGLIVMTGPCRHVIFPMIDDDTAGPPVLDYVGVLAGDGLSVQFRLTESQTATLIGEKYRHKITVNDPEIDGLVVLARGWFSVFGDGDEQ